MHLGFFFGRCTPYGLVTRSNSLLVKNLTLSAQMQPEIWLFSVDQFLGLFIRLHHFVTGPTCVLFLFNGTRTILEKIFLFSANRNVATVSPVPDIDVISCRT